eukprot:TRINITY_DN1490_c0_g1_i2.p1 TRINITY_DN1490_c0_g1~~TRINITY_DN1490_c0_g1_i2.p1  ORF type:complete len:770 (+),score=160.99 TRINITY_DN1490_c0_g1_i2:202-2511(+)
MRAINDYSTCRDSVLNGYNQVSINSGSLFENDFFSYSNNCYSNVVSPPKVRPLNYDLHSYSVVNDVVRTILSPVPDRYKYEIPLGEEEQYQYKNRKNYENAYSFDNKQEVFRSNRNGSFDENYYRNKYEQRNLNEPYYYTDELYYRKSNWFTVRNHRDEYTDEQPRNPTSGTKTSPEINVGNKRNSLSPDNYLPRGKEEIARLKEELNFSSSMKQQFKDFFKEFKTKEKIGYEDAVQFALDSLKVLPLQMHWKVYLEIADLSKRENKFEKAQQFYVSVNTLQPYASKGWLEYAKMEEENGNLDKCSKILTDGLYYCPHSENLLVKGIKHGEKMGNIGHSRKLLSRLQDVSIDRSWRTIMEGGLLEARQGNVTVARKVFKYLISKVPSYGPIYTEAVRLEMRAEEYERALSIVNKGLKTIPNYGPLWFLALKIEEVLDGDYRQVVKSALDELSKELIWKLYYELAQIEDRKGNHSECLKAYVKSVLNCPANLVWKVWIGGARSELLCGNVKNARKLLSRAHLSVPEKMKASVFLDFARLEEYLGDIDRARYFLDKAKLETRHEWKIFLEAVLLEIRANNLEKALSEVKNALTIHTSTGRLWAVLIQLTHILNLENGISSQAEVFKEALKNVPKSGEVWCEGARIALYCGELEKAKRYLDFAIQFTPQYGDSFVEYMRYEILSQRDKPISEINFSTLERLCINAEPTYGVSWCHCKKNPTDSTMECLRVTKQIFMELEENGDEVLDFSRMVISKLDESSLDHAERFKTIYT